MEAAGREQDGYGGEAEGGWGEEGTEGGNHSAIRALSLGPVSITVQLLGDVADERREQKARRRTQLRLGSSLLR